VVALSDEYHQDDIYTRSTDGKGHYETIRNIKVSDALHNVVCQMVADKAFPEYQSIGDVMRDALIHRLRFLSKNYERLSHPVNHEIVLAKVEALTSLNAQKADVIQVYADRLRELQADEEWGAIVECIDAMSLLVDEWTTTNHGRRLQTVIDQYGKFARGQIARLPKYEDELHDAQVDEMHDAQDGG
jgi:hypothetical protein